jgi:hypothetical protein
MEPSPTIAGPSQTSTKIADWRVPFIKYLTDGTGYSDRNENERLICRSRQYPVVDGKLWRKNAKAEVLMKCVEQEDGIRVIHGQGFENGRYCNVKLFADQTGPNPIANAPTTAMRPMDDKALFSFRV